MKNNKKIGILVIVISVIVIMFGLWLKTYNDKIAQVQVNETGTCYLPDGTCLHSTSDLMMYSSFGLAIFLAVLGMYLFLRNEPKKTVIKRIEKPIVRNEPAVIEPPKSLSPETRSIFDLVVQSNGAILQGELITKSGVDKVKVSRILNKLEMLGLIERRRHGMSNLVVLKKR